MAGQPPKYTSAIDMQKAIDDYFETAEIVTITGLALHLGFTSRRALMNYQEKDQFFHTVLKAKMRVEMAYEERLVNRGNGGDIFALKNFGWVDKQEVESKNLNVNYDKEIKEETTAQEASQIYSEIMKNK